MPLETGTFISDLVATNPVGSDPLAFADDHLRLVKSTIKSTFPNITGAVTKTHAQINNTVDKAGDTMTGALTLAGNASADLQAVPRQQVVALVQALYPVGSIYINSGVTTNPATLLGFGTWVAFGAGRVMVGLNGSDALFDALEETGGSKDAIVVSHNHTATSSVNDPGHNHVLSGRDHAGSTGDLNEFGDPAAPENRTNNTSVQTATTGISVATTVASTGSSGTNANLQPYITVAMWKRTA